MVAIREQLNEAARYYNSLLEDEKLAQASLDHLNEGQRRCNLFFGDRPLSISLRPQLVERAQWDRTVNASETIAGALNKLEELLLHDDTLRAELDLDPEEEELILADPPCTFSSPSSRLDGFFTDELRYVEYNAESPAGMAYYDNLVDVFEEMPAMQQLRKRFHVHALHVQERQRETMLQSFREWGREDVPVIAIVDWQDVPTHTEHEMFREHFEEHGIEAMLCDPRELEYADGALYAKGKRVNLIYRRVLTTELLRKGKDASEPMCRAYRDGAACIINTFRAKLLHRKLTLGLLSDERCAHLFTADESDAIARHIPWTRKVKEGTTVAPDGRAIDDLMGYASQNRETLVLKPNDDYGGHGVVLGWTVTQEEWDNGLKAAFSDSYVMQQAIPIPREPFPMAIDGVTMLDLAVDVDPYLFHGRVTGCLTRLSSSALLNVTAGAGSVVPAYVVEGRA